MLRKPRRWLGYTIELNDRLSAYEEILTRFEQSDIPLDDVFGSNSIAQPTTPSLLVAVGPQVEPERLGEILQLLDGLGQVFLVLHDDPPHNKVIYIGAMNLEAAPLIAVSDELRALTHQPGASAEELAKAIGASPKVQPMRKREGT
jgi:hypothetical protein